MIVLLSPAKIQSYKPQHQTTEWTTPVYLSKSAKIISLLWQLSLQETADFLKVNSKIAEQTHNHHLKWNKNHTLENSKQAAWVFDGEAYRGLNIASFSVEDIEYAQSHLGILSGLYGILRPLDLIQPYRVDLGNNTEQILGVNLYQFWKKEVNRTLTEWLGHTNEPRIILNLMSKEYSKLIDRKKINAKFVDIDFIEYQPDTESYKSIVVYIKKARGMMSRFIIKNRITDFNDLKAFSEEGYWFNETLSSENNFVFTR
ncbi:MAG: YaaA family protein [Paludibacteraceae bacterium]